MLSSGRGIDQKPRATALVPDGQRDFPIEQLQELLSDELTPPATQRSHFGLAGAVTPSGDDGLKIRPGGEQLVRETGLSRARAQERLGQRHQRCILGLGLRRATIRRSHFQS